MKVIWKLKILFTILILLYSCAKPAVVNISLPSDDKLSCEELENEIAATQKMKKDAQFAKEGTGGNVARLILFWPAWAQTLHNADTAIQAANDRNFHLINIMKKKNCKGVNIINSKIEESSLSSNNIAGQLKILKDMYDSGDLTKEEFTKAKNKILN